jgi:cyclophilin family peptidyl-prolyl cis-trans isomerase
MTDTRKPRPKSGQQIFELVKMLSYDELKVFHRIVKGYVVERTTAHISTAKMQAMEHEDYLREVNGEV